MKDPEKLRIPMLRPLKMYLTRPGLTMLRKIPQKNRKTPQKRKTILKS